MNRAEVLAMPNRTFWFMAATLTRLMAEQDIRNLTVTNAASSAEGTQEKIGQLVIEMTGSQRSTQEGPQNVELDKQGLDELRAMTG